MAAHLDLIHLRRHALPEHFICGLPQGAGRVAVPRPVQGTFGRPRPLATWRLDAGGRLTCSWSVDTDDPA